VLPPGFLHDYYGSFLSSVQKTAIFPAFFMNGEGTLPFRLAIFVNYLAGMDDFCHRVKIQNHALCELPKRSMTRSGNIHL
jgi:hypothetical protein